MSAAARTVPLLTAHEVAALLQGSLDTVYRLHARGDLPAVRWTETGPLRFRPEDVDAFLTRARRAGTAEAAVEPDAVRGPELARADVPHFSPHALRHRRISLLHRQGVSWAEIGERVGQRSRIVTADRYTPLDGGFLVLGLLASGHCRGVEILGKCPFVAHSTASSCAFGSTAVSRARRFVAPV